MKEKCMAEVGVKRRMALLTKHCDNHTLYQRKCTVMLCSMERILGYPVPSKRMPNFDYLGLAEQSKFSLYAGSISKPILFLLSVKGAVPNISKIAQHKTLHVLM